jgi:hypothetical protein
MIDRVRGHSIAAVTRRVRDSPDHGPSVRNPLNDSCHQTQASLTTMKTIESKSNSIARKPALSDLSETGVKEISTDLRKLLADVFALYVKTKNFHWHMTGPNFRDYHRLLDDHGEQIFAMSDVVAERIRKLGDVALRSIGGISPGTSVYTTTMLGH